MKREKKGKKGEREGGREGVSESRREGGREGGRYREGNRNVETRKQEREGIYIYAKGRSHGIR